MRWRRREHRVAAVALLVVAVVLVAVDDDLVADLPALHLGADRIDDAGRVGAGDVIGVLVHVRDGRDRHAERGPHAVVVDARRHHEDEHVVAVELPGRQHLDLHGLVGRAVALGADRPRVHLGGHVAERRDLADLVQVLVRCAGATAGAATAARRMGTTLLAPAAVRRSDALRLLLCACCHVCHLPSLTVPAHASGRCCSKGPTVPGAAQVNFAVHARHCP